MQIASQQPTVVVLRAGVITVSKIWTIGWVDKPHFRIAALFKYFFSFQATISQSACSTKNTFSSVANVAGLDHRQEVLSSTKFRM